jgi:hypothetical protein
MRGNIKRHKGSIEHISTELMIANPMTKSLPVKKVESHAEYMRLINSFFAWFVSFWSIDKKLL